MAQRPVLPLGSGLGQIKAPSLQGDANEAAFLQSMKSPYADGINAAFQKLMSMGSSPSGMGMPDESTQPAAEPSTFNALDIFSNMFGDPMGGGAPGTELPDTEGGEFEGGARYSPSAGTEIPDSPLGEFGVNEFGAAAQQLAQAQAEAGKKREQFPTRTESFQAAEDQPPAAKGKAGAGDGVPDFVKQVPGADSPAKQATVTALDEYLKLARPGVAPKDYSEYMKEFAEATGLDISGEPDNRAALMSFGLALMQNKAGKGFNVGNILGSVGEAGEAALPAMTEARKEARAMRAKAGEYAINRKKEDEAAAMNRQGYYIVPAGSTNSASSFLQAVQSGTGRMERLNAYELNALDQNTDFNKQYDIIPAEKYESVITEVIKAANKGKDVKDFLETPKKINLFGSGKGETPEWAQVDVFYGNPNSDNRGNNVLSEDPEAVLDRIAAAERGLLKEEQKFVKVAQLLQETSIDQISQAGYGLVQIGRDLGILDVGDQGTNLQQLKYILKTIEVSETANILGEAGKTLSDVDRQLVRDVVGQIDFANADEGLLKDKLREIYSLVISRGKQNIADSYQTLSRYGVNVDRSSSQSSNGDWNEGEDGVWRIG